MPSWIIMQTVHVLGKLPKDGNSEGGNVRGMQYTKEFIDDTSSILSVLY